MIGRGSRAPSGTVTKPSDGLPASASSKSSTIHGWFVSSLGGEGAGAGLLFSAGAWASVGSGVVEE